MNVFQKISLSNLIIILLFFIARLVLSIRLSQRAKLTDYFIRNDGRRRRNEEKLRAVNFRQKEKDILDTILGD